MYRALNAGATGYLLKESAGDEVIRAVRAITARMTYLSQSLRHLEHGFAGRNPDLSHLTSLSVRERQVLQLVAKGLSSSAIAKAVPLSPKLVYTYRSRLMKKLDVKDVAGLIKFAIQHRLTPPG